MGEDESLFADAVANFEEAKIVLFGVPFDGTSSHRSGSSQAPNAIRHESYNFESFLNNYNKNLENIKIHDMGNSKNFLKVSELINELPNQIRDTLQKRKFLITLGGEHSITIPIIKTHLELGEKPDFGIIYLDAHLDFRDSYLNEKYSHACVARRISELVGIENIVEIGIRSYSAEEAVAAKSKNLKFINADTVYKLGMKQVINEAIRYLPIDKIYLTLDIDVFDPSYAPGVGNPEYFGLTPWQIRECIELLGPFMIGADIVEVSPPYDNGNTAALVAQFIQILCCQVD